MALGLNWEGGKPSTEKVIPVGIKLSDGPNAVGFDYFFGFTHARNIATVIEQDHVVANVAPVGNQPPMIQKALAYVDERAKAGGPFFLYFSMCPPHVPVVPAAEFIGKSPVRDLVGHDPKYGDWVYQEDHILRQIVDALDRNRLADNTLVIVTSDNGAEGGEYPPLRSSKRSIYEGGHREPFLAREDQGGGREPRHGVSERPDGDGGRDRGSDPPPECRRKQLQHSAELVGHEERDSRSDDPSIVNR